MNLQELQQLRRKKWHIDDNPIRTIEGAREFLDSVGFCLMYPLKKEEPGLRVMMPTFFGAFAGTDEGLPIWKMAFADPRNNEATELMVRLLRERSAFEANLFGETNFLVSASAFPFFYGLVGDRNPKQMPKPGTRSDFSTLARAAFDVIRARGPISKPRMSEMLGGGPSDAAMDRALGELWSRLRITRVDYVQGEGAYWDLLQRWAPEAVREGIQLSVPQALSALISKYLEGVIAAGLNEIEDFFSYIVSRSRVREAVNALLAAREFSLVQMENRGMIQVTQAEESLEEKNGLRHEPTTVSPMREARSEPIVARNKRRLAPVSPRQGKG